MIKAEITADKETALALTDSGEINAYIELHGSDIKMFTGDNDTINRALKSMLGSYNTMADTYKNIAMVNPSALQEVISKDISEASYVEQNGLGVTRSMIDYYAVSVIVMMIFMSGITGQSEVLKEEKNANTYSRLLLTTTPKLSVFFGKVIGTIPTSVITVGATMIFAVVFFGANYCSDVLGNVLLVVMLLSVSLAATALGTVAGLVMKIRAASVLMPICWQMLFFSGTFSKEIFIEGYSTSLPPYLIQQAAFDLTLFGDGSGAIVVTLVSLAIFVILTIIGAAVFAKKKAV
jgi:ABC-2 type transport system permease protein